MMVWNDTFCLRLPLAVSIHRRSPVSGGSPALRIHPAGYSPPATQRRKEECGHSAGCSTKLCFTGLK
jgi:hypothetical protein